MPDDGNYPKQHPRHPIVEEAKRKFDNFMLDWEQVNRLTSSEIAMIVGRWMHLFGQRMVEIERRVQRLFPDIGKQEGTKE